MRKQVKRIIATMAMCGLMLGSFSHVNAASTYGSNTKWYSNKKGSITVLSSVDTNQYDSRSYISGSIYYQVTGKLNVTAYGYYRNIYGDIYKVTTDLAANKSANEVQAKKYAAYQDVPVCNSSYKNRASGHSNYGGDIFVTRY